MKERPPKNGQEQSMSRILNEKEDPFRHLIRNSFDMIVLLDAEGVQHYVSESCRSILGYTPDELTGIPVIEEMIHPDDQPHVLEGFREILQNIANGGAQYRHRHKEGGWVYLEAFGSNQLENPYIESIILNVRDISDRKKAEKDLKENAAQLRELNATKDRLFSIIGHDLRGPFNGILGLSELLAVEVRDQKMDRVEEYATLIQQSASKVSTLLTNLLDWAMAQSGTINFSPEVFDLTEVAEEVIDLLNDAALQKSITLCRQLPDCAPVIADKRMVHTILRNLVGNGVKFTKPGGSVSLTMEKREEELQVTVTDNGIGIAPENLEKLFHIEHTHSTIGTGNESGTGLGLLLCKELVELHEGKIWVEPGERGCQFHFTLPRV